MPSQTAEDLLSRHRPAPGENITPFVLDRSERTSRHLVFIRDRESPHLHAEHDLTVVLLHGRGTIWIDSASYPMRAGDVTVVAAGTPHYFVNEAAEPSAALVVFAPPLDEPDSVPVGDGPLLYPPPQAGEE
jgi:mannose-6-phosphate isomerase-like protein (cupin superfamily)